MVADHRAGPVAGIHPVACRPGYETSQVSEREVMSSTPVPPHQAPVIGSVAASEDPATAASFKRMKRRSRPEDEIHGWVFFAPDEAAARAGLQTDQPLNPKGAADLSPVPASPDVRSWVDYATEHDRGSGAWPTEPLG
jgi:hypothetical protein